MPICNLSVEGDSGGSMAGRRTSVLVFFEERIQQRDQACRAGMAFIRSTVLVGDHTAELEEQVGPYMGSLGVNWGLIFQG